MSVHGWRIYHVHKAQATGGEVPTFVGGRGVPMHGRVSKAATCLGFDPGADWLTEETLQMPAEERHPSDKPAPQFHCTCGIYGRRLIPENVAAGEATDPKIVFAHATVIGPAVIHPEGWRGAAVRLDYILPVRRVPVPMGLPIFNRYGPPGYTDVWFDDVVADIAKRLEVPILPFDHSDACEDCLEAHREFKHPGPSWSEAWMSKEEQCGTSDASTG